MICCEAITAWVTPLLVHRQLLKTKAFGRASKAAADGRRPVEAERARPKVNSNQDIYEFPVASNTFFGCLDH